MPANAGCSYVSITSERGDFMAPRLPTRHDNGGVERNELRGGIGSRRGTAVLDRVPNIADADDQPATRVDTGSPAASSVQTPPARSSRGNAAIAAMAAAARFSGERLQLIQKRADAAAWFVLGCVVLGILAAWLFGYLPHFAALGATTAVFAVAGYILRFLTMIFVATMRNSAVFATAAVLAAAAAVFGSVGTYSWAYAVSGVSLLAFALAVWVSLRQQFAEIKVAVDTDGE